MKKAVGSRIVALFLCAVLCISVGVAAQEKSEGEKKYDKLLEMAELLKTQNIHALPGDDPIKKALIKMFDEYPDTYDAFVNTMFQSYDRYSYYMKAEDHDKGFDTTVKTGGIGITMEMREDGAYVKTVIEGGAAQKAGIQAGDKLLSVDGKELSGKTAQMIGDLIRGEIGTEIIIKVSRNGEEKKFSVTRMEMKTSTVTTKLLGDGVAYMKIASFDSINTFLDFSTSYEELPNHGVDTVVLDLRDNRGGDFDCVNNILDQIIPKKGIPYLMARRANPMSIKTYESRGIGWKANKMVILVNENTASSAEVLAGSLQDLGYADVVGTRTFGKGYAQIHYQVDENTYAVISVKELILPVTGKYDGVGIKPKFEVRMGSKNYEIPKFDALILDKGVYKNVSTNVLGVEQRLRELGYFDAKPDKIVDEATFYAINRFQKAKGIPVTENYCNAATVRDIDDAIKKLAGTKVIVDTQLEKAKTLARYYSDQKVKPTAVDASEIRFTGEY